MTDAQVLGLCIFFGLMFGGYVIAQAIERIADRLGNIEVRWKDDINVKLDTTFRERL